VIKKILLFTHEAHEVLEEEQLPPLLNPSLSSCATWLLITPFLKLTLKIRETER